MEFKFINDYGPCDEHGEHDIKCRLKVTNGSTILVDKIFDSKFAAMRFIVANNLVLHCR